MCKIIPQLCGHRLASLLVEVLLANCLAGFELHSVENQTLLYYSQKNILVRVSCRLANSIGLCTTLALSREPC